MVVPWALNGMHNNVLLGQITISNTRSKRVNENITTYCTHNQTLNKLPIVSAHVIFWARTPRMESRPAESGCFCLTTVSVFLCPGAAQPSCMQVTAVRSLSLSRKRVRHYLSTLLSDCRCLSSRQRVRYRLFSRQRPRVCLLHFV